MPEEALRVAVANAVAHRDYRSTANVQIYVFKDRIEIVSPGGPAGMEESDLGTKSVPRNPLLFGMLYRMDVVEQIGSGVRRIRELCREHGVAEPLIEVSEHWVTTTFMRPVADVGTKSGASGDQAANSISDNMLQYPGNLPGDSTAQVRDQVGTNSGLSLQQTDVLRNSLFGLPIRELMVLAGKRNRTKFRNQVIRPLLDAGLLEMTIPDKPQNSKQKYRVTAKGKDLLAELDGKQN